MSLGTLKLSIAPGLDFPIDAVTQKFAWLGRSGSGKTYGLKRFVEQMLQAGVQVVILDTVGVWSGLRLGDQGFDVPVLGGLYGDIPLEPTSGVLVADVAVSHGSSLVLDTSQMIDAERSRFCQAFGRRLFELKKAAPSAMHIVLDEGQDVVPQNTNDGEKMMLHEWVRIAKQGRAFGIGLSIASQRPQEVNKKALNQAECVFAFQLTGAHERKALEYWLADKGVDTKLSDRLTTLEIGTPFVWSPQWLKISKVIERILPIRSADTSKTPQFGEEPTVARRMRPIDLGALRSSMAAAVEEAKINDPKALRARVQELEFLVAQGLGPMPAAVVFDKKKAGKIQDSHGKMLGRAQQLVGCVKDDAEKVGKLVVSLTEYLDALETCLESSPAIDDLNQLLAELSAAPAAAVTTKPKRQEPAARTEAHRKPSTKSRSLPAGELAVITAAFQYGERGITTAALRLFTGYAKRSLSNYVSALRSHADGQLVERGTDDRLRVTKAGQAWVPEGTEPLPKGAALIRKFEQELPEGESRCLSIIAAHHPKPVTTERLTKGTDYAPRSISNYISALATRCVVQRVKGGVVVHPEVFS